VIAGVLKSQMDEAKTSAQISWSQPMTTMRLRIFRCSIVVADTVNGKTAEKLIAKVQAGRSVCIGSRGATECREVPNRKGGTGVRDTDAKTLRFMAEAVRDGKLVIPISRKLPLGKAAEAQAAAEEGVSEGLAGGLTLFCEQRTREENRKMKRVCAESTPLRSRVATDVWNAWRHGKVGGFISAGARVWAHRML